MYDLYAHRPTYLNLSHFGIQFYYDRTTRFRFMIFCIISLSSFFRLVVTSDYTITQAVYVTYYRMANAGKLTILTSYLSRGQLDKAVNSVSTYQEVLSSTVTTGGAKIRLSGTVLHISKMKKLGFAKPFGDKKSKREVSYFRLIFCRLVPFHTIFFLPLIHMLTLTYTFGLLWSWAKIFKLCDL